MTVVFFSISVCAGANLIYVNDYVMFHELNEGENMTINCTTTKLAYYTGLSFQREPIPLFYLVPDGKKIIQKRQTFTVTNLKVEDEGRYGCIVMDKTLYTTTTLKAELTVDTRKYCRNSFDHISCCSTTVVLTACIKIL